MVGTTLSQQLMNYIQTMHDQGILDDHFDHVKSMQNAQNPRFVLDVISIFYNDAATGIARVTAHLNKAVVDIPGLITSVHHLKGSSSSIGGQRMSLACHELREACDTGDWQRCLQLFERVKQEYHVLRGCLETISQMERAILANETRRGQP